MRHPRPAVLVVVVALTAAGLFWLLGHERRAPDPAAVVTAPAGESAAAEVEALPDAAAGGLPGAGAPGGTRTSPGSAGREGADATTLYAHNLVLRKGPTFRIYVRWIRGQMQRTKGGVNPSFDDPDSFVLEIQKGVIRANIGDISNFLNANMPAGAPLRNVSIQPAGDSLKLRGTVHKVVPLPVELDGKLAPTPDGRIQFHVNKIDVLKIPVKGLLGGFHLELSDLMGGTGIAGVQVSGNDVFFDTQRLLPPPHIHGAITAVNVATPDLEVIYGGARNDEERLSQWHNFLKLTGGTLDFGKLTMHPVDLTMIDASRAPWFDLDLVNYQAQLVKGYTRMTAEQGLEIFMPDVEDVRAPKKASPAVTLDWLKNKKLSVPAGVPTK